MLCRSATIRASAQRVFARSVSNSHPIPVNVDHYVSGWNIDDIADFIKPGAYNIQTYNKISEQVSCVLVSAAALWCLLFCIF
jgi:hypothetical protein